MASPNIFTAGSHRRRRSSLASPRIDRNDFQSATSSSSGHLAVIPDSADTHPMSLSRSPSPSRSGGWSSPGLTTYDGLTGRLSPAIRTIPTEGNVTWASAKARSEEVNNHSTFSPRRPGFFTKHFRKISHGLPSTAYAEKEKLGRGRLQFNTNATLGGLLALLGRTIWRLRLRFAIVALFLLAVFGFYATRKDG